MHNGLHPAPAGAPPARTALPEVEDGIPASRHELCFEFLLASDLRPFAILLRPGLCSHSKRCFQNLKYIQTPSALRF